MTPMPDHQAVSLYQAIDPGQLTQLARSGWRSLPPASHLFYSLLKLHQRYAEMVARQRLLPRHGAAYVVRLDLPRQALRGYELQTVAYEEHLEYRVPGAELHSLCAHLVGEVQVVSAFRERQAWSLARGFRPAAAMLPPRCQELSSTPA